MPTAARWMLYGATGTTGRLILDEALRRGHRPLVAGRDAPRVSDLAGRHGLEAVPFPLDADECHDALANVAVVVNAAGPYFETGVPLREACLRAGASYIDVNGEVDDFLAALACDARARAKGIAVVPGAGFGVVFGEALAAHVASRLPDATWMRMSLAPATETTSTAAMRSTAAVLAKGGHAVAGGVLEKRPMAFHTWRVSSPEPGGSAIGFAAAPRAELVAAHRLTGIAEIVAGVPLSLPAALALRAGGRLVAAMISRKALSRRPGVQADRADEPANRTSRIWVEARNASGRRVMSLLETGEGYRQAAVAAVSALEATLARRPVGALTPAQAFGERFALSLAPTRITDLRVGNAS